MNLRKLLILAAALGAFGGCELFVNSNQKCDPSASNPCQMPGYVCGDAGVCVAGGTGLSGSSGSTSGSSGSTSGSSGSSGTEFAVPGSGLYGASSITCKSGTGPPQFYEFGGSLGGPGVPGQALEGEQNAIALVTVDGDGGRLSDAARLTTARRESALLDFDGNVFLLGGQVPSGSRDDHISFNSSCSPTVADGGIPVVLGDRWGAAAVTDGPFAYVIGGQSQSGFLNDVQILELADGGLTDAGRANGPVGAGFAYARALIHDNKLYVFGGGLPDGTATADIWSAPILDGGGVGTFHRVGDMNIARAEPGVFLVDATSGQVLVAGGLSGTVTSAGAKPTAIQSVEICTIDSQVTCEPYGSQNLMTPRAGFQMQPGGDASHHFLIVVGGITNLSDGGLYGSDTIEELPLQSPPQGP